MPSLLRATLIVLALLGTAACTSKPMYTPNRIIPATIQTDHEQVKQAILKNLVARQWIACPTPSRFSGAGFGWRSGRWR